MSHELLQRIFDELSDYECDYKLTNETFRDLRAALALPAPANQDAAAIRDAALEEAANACTKAIDSFSAPEIVGEQRIEVGINVCTNLAKAIRALKGKE